MNHRTLSLATNLLGHVLHPHSSLTPLLQAAAARAWVRRVSRTAPRAQATMSPPTPSTSDDTLSSPFQTASHESMRNSAREGSSHSMERFSCHEAPNALHISARFPQSSLRARTQLSTLHLVASTTIDHRDLERRAYKYTDPSLDLELSPSGYPWYWDELAHLGIPVSISAPEHIPCNSLLRPTSSRALFRNLLHLSRASTPAPSLPALLDYHDLFPSLQSTRSYNFLIALALRHASYGTVRSLLQDMVENAVFMNLETQKLRIRWLVQSGWWYQAWDEAIKISRNQTAAAHPQIPLVLWLEFFRTVKRGALKSSASRIHQHDVNSAHHDASKALAVSHMRYRFLMQNLPSLTDQEIRSTPARTVYWMVSSMLQAGQQQIAFSLTENFFRQLPAKLPVSQATVCLDIIHLHIAFDSEKRGIARVVAARRNLVSLLALHPSLQPNSTTLFLLLGGLRQSKHGGTIAWDILQWFKRTWTDKVEDRRVRRRIISLALKEGRMDLVEKLLGSELSSQNVTRMRRLTQSVVGSSQGQVPPSRFLHKPSTKVMFRQSGKEERLWYLMRKRLRTLNNSRNHAGVDETSLEATRLGKGGVR